MLSCTFSRSQCSVYAQQSSHLHQPHRVQPSCLLNFRDRKAYQRGGPQHKRQPGRNSVSALGGVLPRCLAPLPTSLAPGLPLSQPTQKCRQRYALRVAAAAAAGAAASSGSTPAADADSGRFAIVSGLQREPHLSCRLICLRCVACGSSASLSSCASRHTDSKASTSRSRLRW